MKKTIFISALIIISFIGFGFKKTNQSLKVKTYYSINNAMKSPNEVYKLDLMFQNHKEFPVQILKFVNLEDLILRGNQIKSIPKEIGILKQLKDLSLGQNPIKNIDSAFIAIKQLKNLEELDLEMTGIKSIPNSILELKKLKTLYLWNDPIDCIETIRIKALLPNVLIK